MNSSIITTRIRLARNLKDFPFTDRMSLEQKNSLRELIKNTVLTVLPDYTYIVMDEISDLEALSLVERRLISPNLYENRAGSGVILSPDNTVSIMINEEDHLRIQCIGVGECAEKMYGEAKKFSDLFDERLSLAFDDKLGFLTSCPTNLGTGMRASYMVHLPALSRLRQIGNITAYAGKLGFTLRGMYGEGSSQAGGIYQLSNQISMGISEEETIARLTEIARRLHDSEIAARQEIIKTDKAAFEDRIFRSYGVLKNSRLLSYNEFLECYANLREGITSDILKADTGKLDRLIFSVSPGTLSLDKKDATDSRKRDEIRATTVRTFIEGSVG